ncbi:hypothetical protein HII31_00480 [Pseudocercospora fuligena]|uniref:Uncharacterized protein n=1 Tax=Pseudocercospora fuligena TaxID=685502 RepID=A0A8H6RVS0_9PEZI|nr:hypothetical protein HII31_00480 [Pseudocercospora fuligena]
MRWYQKYRPAKSTMEIAHNVELDSSKAVLSTGPSPTGQHAERYATLSSGMIIALRCSYVASYNASAWSGQQSRTPACIGRPPPDLPPVLTSICHLAHAPRQHIRIPLGEDDGWQPYAPCLQPQSAGAVCSTGLPNTTKNHLSLRLKSWPPPEHGQPYLYRPESGSSGLALAHGRDGDLCPTAAQAQAQPFDDL